MKEAARNDNERMERAEEYLAAAREHYAFLKREVADKDEPSSYPLAYYICGLAVECLFRAYSEKEGTPHDAQHDMRRHAAGSRFFEQMSKGNQEDGAIALADLVPRWSNQHRYRSHNALRKYLTDKKLYNIQGTKSVRGNHEALIQHNWNALYDATAKLLDMGLLRWKHLKQK